MVPDLILINPWIYDFAAYDLWSKPLGLLYLASTLRRCGFKVHLIDCLDVHHPEMARMPARARPVRRRFGTGKFWKEGIPRPSALGHISRTYSRYGISRELFIKALKKTPNPAAILVTSLMTYWYPGVQEVIRLAGDVHPNTPVVLGGIYARLCRSHAVRFSGAHRVVSESGFRTLDHFLDVLRQCGIECANDPPALDRLPYPAFDMLRRIDYICLTTSLGCPYRCRYCASHFLNPRFFRRDPLHVLDEILYWHTDFGVQDFAFYDDALLAQSGNHIAILLENLIKRNLNIRFHTPNALHVREISIDGARLLRLSGFRTIRLGLETADRELRANLDQKVFEGEFEKAVRHLQGAGYGPGEIGTYIMMGLPGQSVDSVIKTIEFVDRSGAIPYLAEYSPIPHTPIWKEAMACSDYDLASEPLFHNNTLMPCWDDRKRARLPELKRFVREIRQRLQR